MTKSTDPRKFKGQDYSRAACAEVTNAREKYVSSTVLDWRNQHVTCAEARREFWDLLAEDFGFKIVWPEPEGLASTDTTGSGAL